MDTKKEIELLKKQNEFLYKELLDARNSINVLYKELDRIEAPNLKRNTIDTKIHPLYIRGEVDEQRYKELWKSL